MTSGISRGIIRGIGRGMSVGTNCRMSGGMNQDEKAAQVAIKSRM